MKPKYNTDFDEVEAMRYDINKLTCYKTSEGFRFNWERNGKAGSEVWGSRLETAENLRALGMFSYDQDKDNVTFYKLVQGFSGSCLSIVKEFVPWDDVKICYDEAKTIAAKIELSRMKSSYGMLKVVYKGFRFLMAA